MHEAIDMSLWTGRTDEGKNLRWHQHVVPRREKDQEPGVAILGVASDEGVKRNQGRIGAATGADAIRQTLANQAYHLQHPIYDAGNLRCEQGNLEALQREQAALVNQLLDQNHFPLLLGGGHEIAVGSFLGLEQHLRPTRTAAPIAIINFDAHFDLRQATMATSGTPFLQIAEHCQAEAIPFHYCCLGISEASNTRALFTRADHLGVKYLQDDNLNSWQLPQVEAKLEEFLRPCQALYLSIDLDVLPAETAPGVSAPAARGVPLPILEHLLTFIKKVAQNRLKVADIAEYNPQFDIDGRTARVAARLCHRLIC
ncbi:formimidoylglutamase [uncultured Desulfuromusa sp.]|uniref:formimidoylglutamase n=1 Tax=uncultured Desulfuromusa sp. TaxID=219183 RepID=UPI002AA71D63|nr:formimidoylglutamase [uncultured Desulfuromusa sp.]